MLNKIFQGIIKYLKSDKMSILKGYSFDSIFYNNITKTYNWQKIFFYFFLSIPIFISVILLITSFIFIFMLIIISFIFIFMLIIKSFTIVFIILVGIYIFIFVQVTLIYVVTFYANTCYAILSWLCNKIYIVIKINWFDKNFYNNITKSYDECKIFFFFLALPCITFFSFFCYYFLYLLIINLIQTKFYFFLAIILFLSFVLIFYLFIHFFIVKSNYNNKFVKILLRCFYYEIHYTILRLYTKLFFDHISCKRDTKTVIFFSFLVIPISLFFILVLGYFSIYFLFILNLFTTSGLIYFIALFTIFIHFTAAFYFFSQSLILNAKYNNEFIKSLIFLCNVLDNVKIILFDDKFDHKTNTYKWENIFLIYFVLIPISLVLLICNIFGIFILFSMIPFLYCVIILFTLLNLIYNKTILYLSVNKHVLVIIDLFNENFYNNITKSYNWIKICSFFLLLFITTVFSCRCYYHLYELTYPLLQWKNWNYYFYFWKIIILFLSFVLIFYLFIHFFIVKSNYNNKFVKILLRFYYEIHYTILRLKNKIFFNSIGQKRTPENLVFCFNLVLPIILIVLENTYIFIYMILAILVEELLPELLGTIFVFIIYLHIHIPFYFYSKFVALNAKENDNSNLTKFFKYSFNILKIFKINLFSTQFDYETNTYKWENIFLIILVLVPITVSLLVLIILFISFWITMVKLANFVNETKYLDWLNDPKLLESLENPKFKRKIK